MGGRIRILSIRNGGKGRLSKNGGVPEKGTNEEKKAR